MVGHRRYTSAEPERAVFSKLVVGAIVTMVPTAQCVVADLAAVGAVVVPGFRRVDLASLFAGRGYTAGAEIGVARGRFAEHLCRTISNVHLLCVDPWRAYSGNPRSQPQARQDACFAEATARLGPFNVTIVRAMSLDAAADIPDGALDFVFIDGNHRRDYVLADLHAWSPKVRAGGIVSGDDYYAFRDGGVIEAVETFTRAQGISSWWVTDERRRNHRGVRQPAFFWVQP